MEGVTPLCDSKTHGLDNTKNTQCKCSLTITFGKSTPSVPYQLVITEQFYT
jgi:hypothetical protein